jgi:hypothetical protein
MKAHSTSPRTGDPLDHKFLVPNNVMRQQIAAWCEENGVPVPVAPKTAEADAPPPAVYNQLHKPQVTCAKHPDEQLRVFCVDCNCAVCFICAVDVDLCKSHSTKAFKPLLIELQTDREGWARAQRECGEGAEQLCAVIQADGNAKKQAIDTQVAALQQQVRSAAAARSTALGAILLKRQEREELVAGAAASPQVAVKGSAAAAVVASALGHARAPIPPASAAEFRAAAAPAAAVGHVVVAPAVVDPESEAARAAAAAAEAARVAAAAAAAAAAAEAAAIAAMGGLLDSALLQRVGDRNKVQQFAALMRTKLAGKRYRLLYTWSRDGRSGASFHQHCDNQVRDRKGLSVPKGTFGSERDFRFRKGLSVHLLTLQRRDPRLSLRALPTDSRSAATRLQRGTTVLFPFLLRAASCFGWKPLEAAPPDASTARTRRLRCMADATACMVQYSIAVVVCTYVQTITQHLPSLIPPPPTPTPPGWAPPCSLAQEH